MVGSDTKGLKCIRNDKTHLRLVVFQKILPSDTLNVPRVFLIQPVTVRIDRGSKAKVSCVERTPCVAHSVFFSGAIETLQPPYITSHTMKGFCGNNAHRVVSDRCASGQTSEFG